MVPSGWFRSRNGWSQERVFPPWRKSHSGSRSVLCNRLPYRQRIYGLFHSRHDLKPGAGLSLSHDRQSSHRIRSQQWCRWQGFDLFPARYDPLPEEGAFPIWPERSGSRYSQWSQIRYRWRGSGWPLSSHDLIRKEGLSSFRGRQSSHIRQNRRQCRWLVCGSSQPRYDPSQSLKPFQIWFHGSGCNYKEHDMKHLCK